MQCDERSWSRALGADVREGKDPDLGPNSSHGEKGGWPEVLKVRDGSSLRKGPMKSRRKLKETGSGRLNI